MNVQDAFSKIAQRDFSAIADSQKPLLTSIDAANNELMIWYDEKIYKRYTDLVARTKIELQNILRQIEWDFVDEKWTEFGFSSLSETNEKLQYLDSPCVDLHDFNSRVETFQLWTKELKDMLKASEMVKAVYGRGLDILQGKSSLRGKIIAMLGNKPHPDDVAWARETILHGLTNISSNSEFKSRLLKKAGREWSAGQRRT